MLEQTVKFFEEFKNIVQQVCDKHQKLPIKEILRLFPDIHQAENDLQTLKPLLRPTDFSQLLSIVSFWKNHVQIKHIPPPHGLMIFKPPERCVRSS